MALPSSTEAAREEDHGDLSQRFALSVLILE